MRHVQRGFTLIELMVVITILAILATTVVPRIIGRPDDAKRVKAQQDILALESALELYRLDNGTYPTQTQGLQALTVKPNHPPIPKHWKQGGYIKRMPTDPWGEAYQYRIPGLHGEIDVFSLGSPNSEQAGTTEAYIGNWQP